MSQSVKQMSSISGVKWWICTSPLVAIHEPELCMPEIWHCRFCEVDGHRFLMMSRHLLDDESEDELCGAWGLVAFMMVELSGGVARSNKIQS